MERSIDRTYFFSPQGTRLLPSREISPIGVATSDIQYRARLGTFNSDWDRFCLRNPHLGILNGFGQAPNWHDTERAKADIDLLAEHIAPDALRVSLPWDRLEPQSGRYDDEVLKDQQEIIRYAQSLGMDIDLTLNHFALPLWIADRGGWANARIVDDFQRFTEYVVANIPGIKRFNTVNEPNHVLVMGYQQGLWPPNKKSSNIPLAVVANIIDAHVAAREVIKGIDPEAPVSMASSVTYYRPQDPRSTKDRFAALFGTLSNNYGFSYGSKIFNLLRGRSFSDKQDVFSLQYYTGAEVSFDRSFSSVVLSEARPGTVDGYPFARTCISNEALCSDLGWPLRPRDFLAVLEQSRILKKDIFVSEIGAADERDRVRPYYLMSHLASYHEAMVRGVPLRGFLVWSLLDNLELLWKEAGRGKFGLWGIDPESGQRIMREKSVKFLADVIKTRQIGTKSQIDEFIDDPIQREAMRAHLQFLEETRPEAFKKPF